MAHWRMKISNQDSECILRGNGALANNAASSVFSIGHFQNGQSSAHSFRFTSHKLREFAS
jgi:hypothetical protein